MINSVNIIFFVFIIIIVVFAKCNYRVLVRVCVGVCVCFHVSSFCTITQKKESIQEHEINNVVYENNLNKFDIGHYRIKVKVTAGV